MYKYDMVFLVKKENFNQKNSKLKIKFIEIMKKMLAFLLVISVITGVTAQNRLNRHEYVRMVRSQIFKANGNDSVPIQMGRLEYKQKTRAQIVKMSEAADTVKLFQGLLINSKIGRNEKATFIISSRFVKDTPWAFTLDPQSECPVLLPAGEYVMEIYCGSYYKASIFHVDPRRTHYISGKTVYFAAEKNLSDI